MTNVVSDALTAANSNVIINMQRTLIIGRLATYNLVLEFSAQASRNTDIVTGLQNHNGGFNGVPTVVATNNEGNFIHFSVADGGKLISAETIPAGRWRMAFSYII